MTPRDFCYWLQGYLEISGARVLEEFEVQVIRDHLKLVFSKETPDRTKSGAFLGDNREVFDDKYIKEALGIDVAAERAKMNTNSETLGHPIPAKFDDFLLHSDNLPPLGEIQTRLDRMTNYPLNVDEGSFSYPLVQNIVGCSC